MRGIEQAEIKEITGKADMNCRSDRMWQTNVVEEKGKSHAEVADKRIGPVAL